MQLAKALKLKEGEHIAYGDHVQGQHCSFSREGKVLHVTPNGGIKVRRVVEGKVTSTIDWVCYAHIFNKVIGRTRK